MFLSNLHLEFSNLSPPSAYADIVVLAGDIWKKDHGIGQHHTDAFILS